MTKRRVLSSAALFPGLLLAVPGTAQSAQAAGGPSIQHPIAVGLVTTGVLPALLAGFSELVTYTYDARGRLVTTVRTGTVNNNVQSQYTYDPADNRTNVTVSGATAGSGGDPGSGASVGQPVFIVVPLNGYTLIGVN